MRAIWQVRALSFDPQTHEQLLSFCPVCQKSLGFSTIGGIAFCDFCRGTDKGPLEPSVDLRDFPQSLVETDDDEALRFVTQLIDPDPAVRAAFAPGLSEELAAFGRGELFDMACAIAAVIEQNTLVDAPTPRKHGGEGLFRPFKPFALAEAGRALLDWPTGFFRICERRAGDAAARPTAWGSTKELGAIDRLRHEQRLPAPQRALFDTAIEKFLGAAPLKKGIPRNRRFLNTEEFIGAKEMARTHKIAHKVVKGLVDHGRLSSTRHADTGYSPVLLRRSEAERIVGRYKDLISESSLAVRLGLPIVAMRDLAQIGCLEPAKGPEATVFGAEPHYYGTMFEYLFGFLIDEAPGGDRPAGWTTFNDAMLMFPAGRKPWAAMFEDIFEGRIKVMFHDEPKRRAAIKAISVFGVEARRDLLIWRTANLPSPDVQRVTTGDAMLMLGITVYDVFTACVEAGLLSVDDRNAVAYADVMSFARRFIVTNEIAVRAKQSKQRIDPWLKEHRLSRVHEFQVKGGRLFDREKVEPLLEMRGASQQ